MTKKNSTYKRKIANLKLCQWCCFILLPVLGFGQETKDFQFYNQTSTEIIENYYLTIFENETINNFFPNEKHKISIAKETILKSDSIHLNANFQTIKLSKTEFNTETINVELSQSLDEVVVHDKKEKYWIGADKGSKAPYSFDTQLLVAINLYSIIPSKILAVEIPIKGKSFFLNKKSYKSKFQLLLYTVDENLNLVEKLTQKDLFYTVDKRGSHKIKIDLSNYNIEINQGKYIIVHIKKFTGDLVLKSAPIKKNTSAFGVSSTYKVDSLGHKEIKFHKWKKVESVVKIRVQLEKI